MTRDPIRRHPPTRSAVLLLVSALVAGCAAAPPPPPVPDAATATATRDGVRITLTTEGSPTSGARSWVRAKIENTGTKSVRWGAGGCNLPARIWIDLSTAFAGGREWPGLLGRFKSVALDGRYGSPATSNYLEQALLERSEHETVLCRASLTVLELAAGATLEMRAAWDGKLAGSPAPSGPAVVEAEFPFMGIAGVVDPNNFEIKPISVRVSTHVAGPPASVALAPAAAIDVALADPDFASFVLAEPESTWVNPDVAVIEGKWWVTLFRSRNADPAVTLRGTVMVDHDGKVVGHRFE